MKTPMQKETQEAFELYFNTGENVFRFSQEKPHDNFCGSFPSPFRREEYIESEKQRTLKYEVREHRREGGISIVPCYKGDMEYGTQATFYLLESFPSEDEARNYIRGLKLTS